MNKNKIDVFLLLPVILLILFSLALVYSASSSFALEKFQDSNYLIKQHSIRVLIATLIIFAFAKIDYRYLKDISKYLIWISIFCLIFIFIGGVQTVKGASRWIYLGPFSFQPSDFAKYTLLIYLSALLVRKKEYIKLLYKGYFPLIFYIILVIALIALQPNFSTALIVFGTCILLLFIANVSLKHLSITLLSMIPVGILFILSKSYIIQRLSSHAEFTSGGESNYQVQQALIGFGNGGIFGVGPGNSYQKNFFLPEAHGDFIFSIIGEEYGFIGTLLVISLYIMIMLRGYKIAKKTKDEFGRYLAFSITTLLSFYAIVNMCVAVGIAPTTGVPMPFISYGGTAIIFNSIAVGILLNISSHKDDYETKDLQL